MMGLPLAFGAPAILGALLALPHIWWLLKLTPPRPKYEIFPPLRILAGVLKREETPSKSPWWLTLLRMLMAAIVIFALADPVLNPRNATLSGDGPLLPEPVSRSCRRTDSQSGPTMLVCDDR